MYPPISPRAAKEAAAKSVKPDTVGTDGIKH